MMKIISDQAKEWIHVLIKIDIYLRRKKKNDSVIALTSFRPLISIWFWFCAAGNYNYNSTLRLMHVYFPFTRDININLLILFKWSTIYSVWSPLSRVQII